MKLALAQIDMRLGDIKGICSRIEEQVMLAAKQQVRLLCTPTPLFAGIMPGSLIESGDYIHDLLRELRSLAATLKTPGVSCLVPAVIPAQGSALFEVFLLKEGRVIPTRLTSLLGREGSQVDPWAPPIFDIAGVRVAVTFDVYRDAASVPAGCDLIVFFQVNGFDVSTRANAGVVSVPDGSYRDLARSSGTWIACMAPVGGFDDVVYTGGSFVLDDAGRIIATAPSFEESLLVQEVVRGIPCECIEDHQIGPYNREEWIWGGLRLHLRDTVTASGVSRVALHLSGDLPSALLAVLAADALGPRNVIAVHMGIEGMLTPAQEAREQERAARVRGIASALHIRLVERTVSDGAAVADADVPHGIGSLRIREGVESLCLEDTAAALGAFSLSALTKTDYALAVGAGALTGYGALAPFGDIYLTELEFLARRRNRLSAVLPAELVSLHAVEDAMARAISRAVAGAYLDPAYADRIASLLSELEPCEIDGVFEAHVDRNLPFDEIPLSARNPAAVAMLLLLVRRGEGQRRRMPSMPIISPRSFMERAWPVQLAWSDMGTRGEDRLDAESLAREELDRMESRGEGQVERMRREMLGFIGSIFGLSPEQLESLQAQAEQAQAEGAPDAGNETMEQLEEQLRGAFGRLMQSSGDDSASQGGGGRGGARYRGSYPFFSQN